MESAVGPNSTSTYSSPPPPPYPNGSDTIPSQVSHSMTDSALSSAAAHGVAIETNNAGIGGAHLDSPPSGYDGGSAQQTRLDTRAMLSSGVSKVSAFKGLQERPSVLSRLFPPTHTSAGTFTRSTK